MLSVRNNQRDFLNLAPIDFAFDFDRDERVDVFDMLIARNHSTHFLNALQLITVPESGGGGVSIEASKGSQVVVCIWCRWKRPTWKFTRGFTR